ncbi:MAG: hypothetical protein R2911_28780 [Caldilineaceae bacterium]
MGTTQPNFFHLLDLLPGTYGHEAQFPYLYSDPYYAEPYSLPWAALEEIGITCIATTNGAECPDSNEESGFSTLGYFNDIDGSNIDHRHYISVPDFFTWEEIPGHEPGSLQLPVGSSLTFLAPVLPESTVPCVSGGSLIY